MLQVRLDMIVPKFTFDRQFWLFLIVGTFNTGVSYSVYALGLWIGLAYPVANFASLIVGILLSFVTQGHLVFRQFSVRKFPLFFTTWLLLWGLNVLVIGAVLPALDGNTYVAGAIALLIIVPTSFLFQKYLVFRGGSGR